MTAARRPFAAFVHKSVDLDIMTAPDRIAELAQAFVAASRRLAQVPDRASHLVVFLDTGFNSLVFEDLRPANYSDSWRSQTIALKIELMQRLARHSIRLITPLDLERVIAAAPVPPAPQALSRWLAGDSPRSLYDTPKLVKWLLASANLDDGVPVLTFDEDVLRLSPGLPEDVEGRAAPARFSASIARLLEEYDRLAEIGRPFVLSGQYLPAERAAALLPGGPAPSDSWELDALNGSATRTLFLAEDRPDGPVPLQRNAVRAFFGSLGTTRVSGLGAPAFGVPISGAGLILSNSLARQSPMFSLLRQNLVWCDDAIRAALHAAEDHADIRVVPDAVFLKPRVHVDMRERSERNVEWHLFAYSPGLVLGTVASAWIANAAWRSDDHSANDPQRMWDVARERLQFVVDVWGDSQFEPTCLGSFVSGKRTAPYAPRGLRVAVESLPAVYPGPLENPSANASLEDRLRVLVQDFVDYPRFRDYWRHDFVPAFLQSAATDHPWRIS